MEISLVVILLVVFILLLSFGSSFGVSCYNQNITLTNHSNFVCTSQWVNVERPVSLISKNISAKGIFINNTFSITGNSTLNVSTLINKGNTTINATLLGGINFENYGVLLLKKPIFINFSYFLNKGIIINQNYLNNGGYTNAYLSYNGNNYGCGGESYPFSYAGSGGGSLANFSACNGGNTLVIGGPGQVTSYLNKVLYPPIDSFGKHVYSSLSNYSFNLSLLNSAGGASYNGVNNSSFYMRGGSGVLPLIIISKSFNNTGEIYNQGQSINYSDIKNASKFIDFGIVGAGGGGIIEVISSEFINNGTFNVSGGSIQLNSPLSLPKDYSSANLGYGGVGNVFLFKANPKLLLASIPSYQWSRALQDNYVVNYSENYSKKLQNYSVIVKIQSPLGCSLNGIYVNLKGIYNNSTFLETKPINNSIFSVNSSIKNIYLYLSGRNPITHYYNGLNLVFNKFSNNSVENFNLSKYIPVNISFEGKKNLSFNILEGNKTLYSDTLLPNSIFLELKQGKYLLSFANSSDNYTYGLYVEPNCLGYENITISPGKSYYLYDSLNVSTTPFIKYKIETVTKNITEYRDINSCNFNISSLINLNKEMLEGIYSINHSISMALNRNVNYTNLLSSEENYTNYVLKAYSNKGPKNTQGIYLNETGLDLLSYYSKGNLTKEVFQINNNGTINVNYGLNKSIKIILTKRTHQNFFVSTENYIIKVFSYLPSLFMGFLGGL
ncbi:MAG: hypothetical protein ACP5MV_01970 [Candidatus Parvarchaeum sp.]